MEYCSYISFLEDLQKLARVLFHTNMLQMRWMKNLAMLWETLHFVSATKVTAESMKRYKRTSGYIWYNFSQHGFNDDEALKFSIFCVNCRGPTLWMDTFSSQYLTKLAGKINNITRNKTTDFNLLPACKNHRPLI